MNKEEATEIFEKMQKSKIENLEFAIFFVSKAISYMKTTTQQFKNALSKRPDALIGIYNADATAEQIAEDIEYFKLNAAQ